jgi:hypothetical protein
MSGYIGVEPVTQVTKVRTFGTLAVASTTIPVAGGFSPGNIEVYLNGNYVLPTDYDESDGLNVVFGITLTIGTDYVVIEARQFLVADTWSKAEADARYAEITGGADANFAVMPQVGGDPVVESGSNADGEWTRWADGTQIISNGFATSASATATWTYPVSFISGTYRLNSMVQAGGSAFIATTQSKALASIGVNCWEGISTTLERRANTLDITAIGRWK